MEEKRIDKLYELLEKGNFDNETSAALKWAIFELESIYGKDDHGGIEATMEATIDHPKFSVGQVTDAELAIIQEQEPVLRKLEALGYGLYIKKDFYMPIPAYLEEERFPLDLCYYGTEEKVVVQSWDELVKITEQ